MFTGIIEETGTVLEMKRTGGSTKIQIRAKRVLHNTKTGDSIAVNGVCLTVTELGASDFTADVMPETVARSSLGRLTAGDNVN